MDTNAIIRTFMRLPKEALAEVLACACGDEARSRALDAARRLDIDRTWRQREADYAYIKDTPKSRANRNDLDRARKRIIAATRKLEKYGAEGGTIWRSESK